MEQHFIARSKNGEKNVNYFFGGYFQLLEFQGVLITIISMNAKALEFDVIHVHIVQDMVTDWYWPLPNIESLIFLWWGKFSSNATCLFLATNTAPVQRSEPSRPRSTQT
jgi:hypothetical protein